MDKTTRPSGLFLQYNSLRYVLTERFWLSEWLNVVAEFEQSSLRKISPQ